MKSLLIGSLSVLLLTAVAVPVANGQPVTLNSATTSSFSRQYLTPFKLVHLAYQGYFKDQGIPGYSALVMAHEDGKVSAEDLVVSAVKANRLSAQLLRDQEYFSAVDTELWELKRGGP
ncbi:MAG: hypothetical protein JOZ78_09045 [Chroococcidiopsidaceae cyanobacterium CP_BM_ER_R8_30]|nr:hypothetical protein [Chroococcidiopsidaceae cyanobacterium CP_BM_ER_R8_30]